MSRRTVLSVAAAALAATLAYGAPPSQALPTFRLSDAGVNGSELNVGVAPNGSIFVGGWDSIARSTDDGLTWTKHRTTPGVAFAADRVLIVDKDTGRVMVNDTTLGCTIMAWSDDNGATWTNNPTACGGGVTDHQKIAVGRRTRLADPTGALYPNLMYVCANGLSHTDCGVSPDGGITWLTTTPHGVGCAFQGTPVADVRGVLYEPTSQCGLRVRFTADNGATWTERALGAAFPTSRDTPDLTVTPDGTIYLFYVDSSWQPRLARSTNGGLSWTGIAVPVTGLKSALFPSIVSGDDGRIALSFYGTTDDAIGWNHNPGDAPAAVRWHGYVAVVTDAAAVAPTITPVRVTDDPLQYGCLSKLGGCLGNIADYADIDAGPDGRVTAVFTDGCLPGCTSAAQSTASRAVVAVQTGGDDLRP